MNDQKINLARKWRSQNFDQVVGQDLSIRMLKNSLYLGHYFPVYLFSGQRGCGKTSTARIFAAAINCEHLEKFKTNPHEWTIPCLTCESCKAVKAGKHPDFIEMDAASYTGVDNIRTIIEASTFMPLMGNKKIYLIDEAHMLSKAAFNAFLKILEEPPFSVVFILATTDPEKIIETVRSRCFQLSFKPVNNQLLIDHLQHVCLVESIAHDKAGLELIAKESQGSVRDALNMLEQVRFSSSAVTLISVSQVLGHIDDRSIFELLKAILLGSEQSVIMSLNDMKFGLSTLDFLFKRMIDLVRGMLWYKYGIKSAQWSLYESEFSFFSAHCSAQLLHHFLQTMHKEYGLFVKTTAQHAFLEMVCIGIAQRRGHGGTDSSEGALPPLSAPTASSATSLVDDNGDDEEENEDDDIPVDQDAQNVVILWKRVVAEIVEKVGNQLLTTVLQQGTIQKIENGYTIYFPKDLQFFADVVQAYNDVLTTKMKEHFGADVLFTLLFTHEVKVESKDRSIEKKTSFTKNNENKEVSFSQPPKKYTQNITCQEQLIDISNKESWKKTHMVLEFFPGRITEIRENINEQQI